MLNCLHLAKHIAVLPNLKLNKHSALLAKDGVSSHLSCRSPLGVWVYSTLLDNLSSSSYTTLFFYINYSFDSSVSYLAHCLDSDNLFSAFSPDDIMDSSSSSVPLSPGSPGEAPPSPVSQNMPPPEFRDPQSPVSSNLMQASDSPLYVSQTSLIRSRVFKKRFVVKSAVDVLCRLTDDQEEVMTSELLDPIKMYF
jgi:hypothetical protein